ncbi:hypothetical protein NKI48_03105 [Mesorhizobium sp. M0644]|uniref:hypothetical protein n=1 Tax=Mesorhizobium sp. M0644 TaxID=2956979 RepID=UPI00333D7594
MTAARTLARQSAYSQTTAAIAGLGKPRAKQAVHILTKRYGGPLGARYTVLVAGEYYDCGQHVLDALLPGATPEWLEIEPANPEDDFNEVE